MNITTTYDEAMVKAMIAEAVAKEREECAKVCKEHYYAYQAYLAIRARGQQ